MQLFYLRVLSAAKFPGGCTKPPGVRSAIRSIRVLVRRAHLVKNQRNAYRLNIEIGKSGAGVGNFNSEIRIEV